jgi:predicted GIY-YIG superfamily endonuclease
VTAEEATSAVAEEKQYQQWQKKKKIRFDKPHLLTCSY